MLKIENLSVEVEGKPILNNVNINVPKGETHALFGPNGSGKTTLLMAIMGFPRYRVTGGKIIFEGQDITQTSLDERARIGVGMSFQRPPIVRGVQTRDILNAAMSKRSDTIDLDDLGERLNVVDLMKREVNYGFSGGEIKRSELLQLFAQSPRLVLLDEPESGVDLVNMALIGKITNELLEKDLRRTRTRSALIITHTGHILEYVNASKGYVMVDGTVRSEGDALDVFDCIKQRGYEECVTCQR